MLYNICGWYSLVMLIIGVIATIVKDGSSTTKYTGGYKLLNLIMNAPVLYFVILTLQR